MAAQSLIEQHIALASADGSFDEGAILGNEIIQDFASNSAGGRLISNYQNVHIGDNSSWLLDVKGYISSEYQSTLQGNISSLQSALSQYIITTWGIAVTYGS